MTSIIEYFTQGIRILFTSWKNRLFPKRYKGTAEQICKKIVRDCWNGRFYQTSAYNFKQFWTRDFGWTTKSLLKLGHQEEVHKTLRYALNRFKQYGKVTTSITLTGKPFDFPVPAVDSLPWLIHSIKISKFSYHTFKPFLNQQIEEFFHYFIDPQTGLVKPDLHVSSMKDQVVRRSSCYDNCTVALLAKDLKKMKLINPFSKFNYSSLIKRHFWSGEFFYDDLSHKDYLAADANIFPFIFGIIDDKDKLLSVIKNIQEAELDQPWPLKYTKSREGIEFTWQEFLMPDYESDALWTHMGPLYIKLVQEVDKSKAKEYKEKYREWIEKYGGFLEVFNSKGEPYSCFLYYCDFGMVWAANYLTL